MGSNPLKSQIPEVLEVDGPPDVCLSVQGLAVDGKEGRKEMSLGTLRYSLSFGRLVRGSCSSSFPFCCSAKLGCCLGLSGAANDERAQKLLQLVFLQVADDAHWRSSMIPPLNLEMANLMSQNPNKNA